MKQFSLLRRLTNPVQSNARKITTYHSTNNPHPLHLAEKDNIGIVGLPLNKGQVWYLFSIMFYGYNGII